MRHLVNRVPSLAAVFAKVAVATLVTIGSYSPSQAKTRGDANHAAIVVDANTGKVLYGDAPDAPRHPASLTKMMTLYMIFEAMEAGRISKRSAMPISRHAASMAPTKLGAKAGTSISVETAILGLVTKSANDAAAASAEFLGGSEDRFAPMMTAKARSLGMKNTRFYNASGLPDPRQITTARDMAVLGIALRTDFPQYYPYFSVRSFTYGRSRLANHNKLLGRVAGVDGIKTGYTRASGFNLVSSVALNDKKLVTVVLGGNSGRARDTEVASLIQKYLPNASSRASGSLLAKLKGKQAQDADVLALADPEPVAPAKKAVALIEPVMASVVPTKRPTASLTQEIEENASADEAVDPIVTASAEPEMPAPSGNGAWVIQIAAADSEDGAMTILNKAQASGGRALATAKPFTQAVQKGSATLFRARFSGFDSKQQAWNACEVLKRKQFGCFAMNK